MYLVQHSNPGTPHLKQACLLLVLCFALPQARDMLKWNELNKEIRQKDNRTLARELMQAKARIRSSALPPTSTPPALPLKATSGSPEAVTSPLRTESQPQSKAHGKSNHAVITARSGIAPESDQTKKREKFSVENTRKPTESGQHFSHKDGETGEEDAAAGTTGSESGEATVARGAGRDAKDVAFVLRKLYTGGALDAQQEGWDSLPMELFNTLTMQVGTINKVCSAAFKDKVLASTLWEDGCSLQTRVVDDERGLYPVQQINGRTNERWDNYRNKQNSKVVGAGWPGFCKAFALQSTPGYLGHLLPKIRSTPGYRLKKVQSIPGYLQCGVAHPYPTRLQSLVVEMEDSIDRGTTRRVFLADTP